MSENESIMPPGMESDPEGEALEKQRAREEEKNHALTDKQRMDLLYEASKRAQIIAAGESRGDIKRRIETRIWELEPLEKMNMLGAEELAELAVLREKYGKL